MQKLRWWPTALIAGAILWLTLAPHPLPENDVQWFEGADKVVHAIMFFALTTAVLFDYRSGVKSVRLKSVVSFSVGVVVFAALDEWAQGLMNMGRTTDPVDFLADCIGILVSSSLFSFIYIRR